MSVARCKGDQSGYPGGPAPGHYWKVTYSGSGTNTSAIPNDPSPGASTPQSEAWNLTSSGVIWASGGPGIINGNCSGSVTVTLTWIPTAGQTTQSDPPAKMVSIIETGSAWEYPGSWGGAGAAPVGVGSASNGLGDAQVPDGSGYTCSGSHRVKKDGSSGTITLGPFKLTAVCPVSTFNQISIGSGSNTYEYYYWDWMDGVGEVSFSIAVVPPAYPTNFRMRLRNDGTPDVDILDGGELRFHYVWDSSTDVLSDLDDNNCMVYENVTYAGNSTGILLPDRDTGVL